MISFKNNKLEKIFTYFLVFSFIIMTLPRSIKNVSETIYYGINYFKIALVFIIFLITIIKKVKLSKFTLLFVIYMAYTFLTTIINHQSPVYFFKIYTFNFGIILLCELIMKCNDRKRIFHFISKYLVVILSLNLLDILLYKVFSFGFKSYYNIYLLGIDNRFILYIFATIITYLYLYIEDERLKIDLYIAYIVGLLSVFLVWSVSAACVVALIGFLFLILKKKKIHINPYIVLICILLIAFLIPFFKIHYMFKFIIVDILHKPLDLSYRVDVWNVAIDYIFKHISKVFNVSTDYLLGISEFENAEIDRIAINRLTGLSDNAINNLVNINKYHSHSIIDTINYFLEQEKYCPD